MLETEQYVGLTIRYEQDEDAPNPRENDNFGTMVCFHSRYNLGDKHSHKEPEEFFDSLAEEAEPGFADRWGNEMYTRMVPDWATGESKEHRKAWMKAREQALWKIPDKHYLMLPLYLYDHSGISMSTGDFRDRWDSGQVGWIYATRENALREYGGKILTKKTREQALALLESEVKTYNAYLTGSCYGYEVKNEDGEVLDSCWGFLITDDADVKYLQEEARSSAKYHADQLVKEKAQEYTSQYAEQFAE